MFQSFSKTLPLAISEMSGFSDEASNFLDNQDRAFRVASSLGSDLSLDDPILDSSDLCLLGPPLMLPRHHREENDMRTQVNPVSPYLLRPLRNYEEAVREEVKAKWSKAGRDIAGGTGIQRSDRQRIDNAEPYQ